MRKSSVAVILAVIFFFGGFIFVLAASVFGIWLAGDSGIREILSEINTQYNQRIADIRNQTEYDELVMSGTQSDWPSVLSVYAVLTSMDPDAPSDVVTVNESSEKLLREIFWKMNTISWETEVYELPDPNAPGDEDEDTGEQTPELPDEPLPSLPNRPGQPQDFLPDGSVQLPAETEATEATEATESTEPSEPPMIEQTRLVITVSHLSAAEMADVYRFTEEQRHYLEELLLPENRRLWNDMIYGISSGGNGNIIAVASSQVGNYNGLPYKNWYGVPEDTAWCAIFVSWCANEAGLLEAGLIPRFAWVPTGIAWFQERGQWADRYYIPSPGDLIFFDWENDGDEDHVGIVEYVDETHVHTIEGNRNNSVIRDSFPLGSVQIFGYGRPDYNAQPEGSTEGTTE